MAEAQGRSRTVPTNTDGPVLLELHGLSVRLGGRLILDRLEGRIDGRIVGLLGPNGAGKTTLLRTLLGFYSPAAGGATVLGHVLTDGDRTIRAMIGYMPEDDSFVAGMTAVRFVRMMAELGGLPPDAALEQSHEALSFVGLGEARYRKVGTFSTGMKQKVKLAQALVHGPDLLLLDEPTNGLDPTARERMLGLIESLGRHSGTGILVSSHLLGDVERVCDQVLILKDGRVAGVCDLGGTGTTGPVVVDLETDPPDDAYREALQAIGCTVEPLDRGRLRVTLGPEREIRDLFAAAAERNVGLRRLDRAGDALQDIFLRAMEDHDGHP